MAENHIDYPGWESNQEARVKQALSPIQSFGFILQKFPMLELQHDFMVDAGEIMVALYERAVLMLAPTENPSQGGGDHA